MLIKEYRICLPLSVQEYQIAQLYMIQKKSREESSGSGSGVEILVNEPYKNGPSFGPEGQYTHKVYHIGSHLPAWFRSILPKSALRVEEEAWNAYPYTKTIYTCPFVEKFSIEIETRYANDDGRQENIFNLSSSDLRNRTVDNIDIIHDQLSGGDYLAEEDPRLYVSKTAPNRCPLADNWKTVSKQIMCAYKICRVEFKYWGMQTKIEKFIHDIGLRKTMVRAHRQAWCWQDEYYGMTMADIRRLENETQLALAEKMRKMEADNCGLKVENRIESIPLIAKEDHRKASFVSAKSTFSAQIDEDDDVDGSSEEDEFYDAEENFANNQRLLKSTSMEFHIGDDDITINVRRGRAATTSDDIFASSLDGKLERVRKHQTAATTTLDVSVPSTPTSLTPPICRISVLIMVAHGGSLLEPCCDHNSSKSVDANTLRSTIYSVVKSHYTSLIGRIAVRMISCPAICAETLHLLSSLSPNFKQTSRTNDAAYLASNFLPVSSIALFATSKIQGYTECVLQTARRFNQAYVDFIGSDEGCGFTGNVCIIGDSVGSLLVYDGLVKNNPFLYAKSELNDLSEEDELEVDGGGGGLLSKSNPNLIDVQDAHGVVVNDENLSTTSQKNPKQLNVNVRCAKSLPGSRRTSSTNSCASGSGTEISRFHFEVSDFFMFGAPLGLVLAFRRFTKVDERITPPPTPNFLEPTIIIGKQSSNIENAIQKPACQQIYNIFYSTDPCASRIEPLIIENFLKISPINLSRYQKYPLGDGETVYVAVLAQERSDILGMESLNNKWWGKKRLDYVLYCPEQLSEFHPSALPYLLQSSFWESYDAVAFILRQIFSQPSNHLKVEPSCLTTLSYKPDYPTEKWLRRRTTMKVRNAVPNHRANDVLTLENKSQILTAKFTYGPFALTYEMVDIHVYHGEQWTYLCSVKTDSNGKAIYELKETERLSQGIYPIIMTVKGDHTTTDFNLAVLPKKTETIVFSIDGSFTASVSIMGKNPKVRPCSVDVVRHWQDLGYLILYITARPDMQLKAVVGWLAEHKFPFGMVAFMDGIKTEPLKEKLQYLSNLVQEADIKIHAAYGSSKDISVYQTLNIPAEQIFIIGKVSKKQQKDAVVISGGYLQHLENMVNNPVSRPAAGNAKLILKRRSFYISGQNSRQKQNQQKKSVCKTVSLPPNAKPTIGFSSQQREPPSPSSPSPSPTSITPPIIRSTDASGYSKQI